MLQDDQRKESVESVKTMLKWDVKERIAPGGILSCPFITKYCLSRIMHILSSKEEINSVISLFSLAVFIINVEKNK